MPRPQKPPDQVGAIIHELHVIKAVVIFIAEFLLSQPESDAMTPEQKATLQAKSNAIKAKLDAASVPLDASVDKLTGTT